MIESMNFLSAVINQSKILLKSHLEDSGCPKQNYTLAPFWVFHQQNFEKVDTDQFYGDENLSIFS